MSDTATRARPAAPLRDFTARLAAAGLTARRGSIDTLQINLGKRCNQACSHCHVEAGPRRTEMMTPEVVERVLAILARSPGVRTVDITGGAPELHPAFRQLVRAARADGRTIIDRCNLTVLSEPGQEDTAAFLAALGVRVVASLPCYLEDNVDRQRGQGVFERSLAGLRQLNALGYGRAGGQLTLDLVYNPQGATLPPPQATLEAAYRRELGARYGIEFSHLLALTNLPVNRFRHALDRDQCYDAYMALLDEHFNPQAAERVMCRSLVSVSWDGRVYDCDFNQMLELAPGAGAQTVWDITSLSQLEAAPIAFGPHCYGCTAGAGSSCSGALA